MDFVRTSEWCHPKGQGNDADHDAFPPVHHAYRPSDSFAIGRPVRVDNIAGAKSIVYIREPTQILKYENGGLSAAALGRLHDQTLAHHIEHDLGGVVKVQLLHQVRSMRLHCR